MIVGKCVNDSRLAKISVSSTQERECSLEHAAVIVVRRGMHSQVLYHDPQYIKRDPCLREPSSCDGGTDKHDC